MREDYKLQYKLAVDLWTAQHQGIWAMFNNVVLANSILIAGIIILFNNNQKEYKLFQLILSILGLIINIIWRFINKRGYRYQTLRISQARYYEYLLNQNNSSKSYDLVEDGHILGSDCPDSIRCEKIDKKLETNFYRGYCFNLKTELLSEIIIWLFAVLYLFFIVYFAIKM